MPKLTAAELAAIEAREKAATPGPWTNYDNRTYVETYDGESVADTDDRDIAAFIAHARADIPALIAALRESRERAEAAETLAAERMKRNWALETAGRTWFQALDLMRSMTTHDPRQGTEVVKLFTEAEKQMRAALGEETQ